MRLPVASAFHSYIVSDSCDPFYAYLGSVGWSKPKLDVFANTTAARDHNLYTRGTRIFQANYRAGMRVLDATNPLSLSEHATNSAPPSGASKLQPNSHEGHGRDLRSSGSRSGRARA